MKRAFVLSVLHTQFRYKLSGRPWYNCCCCILADDAGGIGGRAATIELSFFILLLTRVERCADEMLLSDRCCVDLCCATHCAANAAVAPALLAGSAANSRETRSLASVETREKCSGGKEKSQRRMLFTVSSSESSRKGDNPLEWLREVRTSFFSVVFSIVTSVQRRAGPRTPTCQCMYRVARWR